MVRSRRSEKVYLFQRPKASHHRLVLCGIICARWIGLDMCMRGACLYYGICVIPVGDIICYRFVLLSGENRRHCSRRVHQVAGSEVGVVQLSKRNVLARDWTANFGQQRDALCGTIHIGDHVGRIGHNFVHSDCRDGFGRFDEVQCTTLGSNEGPMGRTAVTPPLRPTARRALRRRA